MWSIVRAMSRFGSGLLVLVVGLGVFGCSKKNEGKCTDAKSGVTKSVEAKDYSLARQWRERAYKYCKDPSSVDSQITGAEQSDQQAKAAKEKIKKEAVEMVRVLSGLASQGKADASKVAASAQCPDEKKKEEGWCTASRTVRNQPQSIQIKFWNEEKDAASFSVKPAGPVKCADLGPGAVSRKWNSTIDGTVAQFEHCSLNGGELSGMQALVGSSDKLSLVQIFTPKYLARDGGLKKRVSGG